MVTAIIRLIVLLAIGWAVFSVFSPSSPPSDKVTVCRAMCEPIDIEFWECGQKGGKLTPVDALRFKVSVADQTVFQEQDTGPYKFTSCKVMDTRNWSCPYNDKSGEIGMGNGKYYEIFSDKSLENEGVVKATGQVPCSRDMADIFRYWLSYLQIWKK